MGENGCERVFIGASAREKNALVLVPYSTGETTTTRGKFSKKPESHERVEFRIGSTMPQGEHEDVSPFRGRGKSMTFHYVENEAKLVGAFHISCQ